VTAIAHANPPRRFDKFPSSVEFDLKC